MWGREERFVGAVLSSSEGRSLTEEVYRLLNMRQLRGKPAKESKKEKRERKKQNLKGQEYGFKYVLPVLLVAFGVLIGLIYSATH